MYDGKMYEGWQKPKEGVMKKENQAKFTEILELLREGEISLVVAQKRIEKISNEEKSQAASEAAGANCVY